MSVDKPRILVIDDEESLTEILEKLFQNDFRSEICSDGKSALQLILSRRDFDIILCDLMMPGFSGMDIFEELRNEGSGLERRLVFMTGGTFTQAATDFLGKVLNQRLIKPFSKKEFKAIVEVVLKSA